jgi:hypothetical protein
LALEHTDTVRANIDLSLFPENISFVSTIPSQVTVTPSQISSRNEDLTLEEVTDPPTRGDNVIIKANNSGPPIETLAQLKVATYPLRPLKVAIRCVGEDSGTPAPPYISDDTIAEIEGFLNETYKKACLEWQVGKLPSMSVNYDLNPNDSKLEVRALGDWSEEEEIIIVQCQDLDDYDYNIFIVSSPSEEKVGGEAGFNQEFAFVFADVVGEVRIPATCAHEIGHALNLNHPSSKWIRWNVMYSNKYDPGWYIGTLLFKGQWDIIDKWIDK